MAINPTVQVRIEPNLRKKIEARAIERGFTKKDKTANLPVYFRFLALEDLTTKLDAIAPPYKKEKW